MPMKVRGNRNGGEMRGLSVNEWTPIVANVLPQRTVNNVMRLVRSDVQGGSLSRAHIHGAGGQS